MNRPASFLLTLGLALSSCEPGGAAAESAGKSGDAAPRLADVDGVVAALAAERGHGFLFNVWAMWCPPCVAELPELVEIGRAYRAEGGGVLALSYDLMIPGATREHVADQVCAFLAGRKLELRTLILDAPDYDAINARLDLPGPVPVTLAIDRDGKVVDRQEGAASRERFEAMMRKALGLGS